MAAKENTKTIASNKKAFHDYFVEESLEAGIELAGTEVKSLRRARSISKTPGAPLKRAKFSSMGCISAPMIMGNIFNREPLRPGRLLLHKREILRLFGLMKRKATP